MNLLNQVLIGPRQLRTTRTTCASRVNVVLRPQRKGRGSHQLVPVGPSAVGTVVACRMTPGPLVVHTGSPVKVMRPSQFRRTLTYTLLTSRVSPASGRALFADRQYWRPSILVENENWESAGVSSSNLRRFRGQWGVRGCFLRKAAMHRSSDTMTTITDQGLWRRHPR